MNIDYEETDWYPGDVKPVHVGLYRRKPLVNGLPSTMDIFCWWDGHRWSVGSKFFERATTHGFKDCPSFNQNNYQWRGLLVNMSGDVYGD